MISSDFDSQLQRLEEVYRRRQDTRLKLKPAMGKLLQDEVHIVSAKGVAINLAKVKVIKKWESLKHAFLLDTTGST